MLGCVLLNGKDFCLAGVTWPQRGNSKGSIVYTKRNEANNPQTLEASFECACTVFTKALGWCYYMYYV